MRRHRGVRAVGWALFLVLAAPAALPAVAADRADILFADFEGTAYDPWEAKGAAFGPGPAAGTLPRQMDVSGFSGRRLVNSFHGGDETTGMLRSPEFTIERKYISFLIGGGGHEDKTCVNLVVEGKTARTATGPNVNPGGTEALAPAAWDVSELQGASARIEVIDRATGGWGHINLDHVVFTDARPPALDVMPMPRSRRFTAEKRYLHFPVKNGARERPIKVIVDGKPVREFTIEAADGDLDWWASLDISTWRGRPLTVDAGRLPGTSRFVDLIDQGEIVNKAGAELYREPLRPLIRFSPRRGWNNDPNGLVYYNGEYHLFFQLNPYGTRWGNMHWGHAVSKDLVHWEEIDIALYPDSMGPMFSGSAVVDWKNTSGLGKDSRPPLVLIYTAAGDPTTQCIAWSLDGRTFTKYEKNPVVRQITGGNRDPKVIWHEPTRRWVMTLYVGFDQPKTDPQRGTETKHTIHFLTSPNLKDWEVTSQVDGFFECPDFFPLILDGDDDRRTWLLTAANSEYMLGAFDGKTFMPKTPKLKGHLGRGFYAAQTFSDIPSSDGRRIMIGWMQAPSPGMPFNQAMSVPLELSLLGTAEGPRLAFAPVREIERLRTASVRVGPLGLKPGDADPLMGAPSAEALDVRMDIEPSADARIEMSVRGVRVGYDASKQELSVNDQRAAAPLRAGRQRLIVLADRTCVEVFASDGLCYVPLPVTPDQGQRSVAMKVTRGAARLVSVEAHALRSIWNRQVSSQP